MQVLSLALFPVMGLNNLHQRPYKTHISYEGINKLEEATQGGRTISQGAISRVASDLVSPSAEAGNVVGIANGWQEPRFRFVLKILESEHFGSQNIVFYIGHTDRNYDAVSQQGHIADNLQFFINSTHRVRLQSLSINGASTNKIYNVNDNQIIYGKDTLATLESNGYLSSFILRPYDIYNSQSVAKALGEYDVLDGNVIDSTGSLLYGAESSQRRNNTPGTYLYDTLKAYQNGISVAQSNGYDEKSIIDEALYKTHGNDVKTDPFFYDMSRYAPNLFRTGQFSWSELVRLFPYVDDVTQVYQNNDIVKAKMQNGGYDNSLFTNTWHAGNTMHWGGSSNETVAASLIANAFPTIMLENLITDVRIAFTNNTLDGTDSFQILSTPITLDPCIDAVTFMERAMERVRNEIIPQISLSGMFRYNVLVDASVVGETMVSISLNGEPEYVYVMPTFADNMASPIITSSSDHFTNFVNDIYTLTRSVLDKQSDVNMPPIEQRRQYEYSNGMSFQPPSSFPPVDTPTTLEGLGSSVPMSNPSSGSEPN